MHCFTVTEGFDKAIEVRFQKGMNLSAILIIILASRALQLTIRVNQGGIRRLEDKFVKEKIVAL